MILIPNSSEGGNLGNVFRLWQTNMIAYDGRNDQQSLQAHGDKEKSLRMGKRDSPPKTRMSKDGKKREEGIREKQRGKI